MPAAQRAKISAAKRGHAVSAETRAKIAASLQGQCPSDETRRRLSAARRGKTLSAETRAKISAANKGRSHASWSKPKPFTDEHRRNLRVSHLGLKPSAEAIAKQVAARLGVPRPSMRGRKHTAAHRRKIADAHRGQRRSPEARARMSAAAIRAREAGRQNIPKSRRYTKLAQRLHAYLTSRGFTVEPEVRFGRYTVDLYDREHHIAHEADGKYWHAKNELARPGYHVSRDEYLHDTFRLPVMRYSDTEIKYLEM